MTTRKVIAIGLLRSRQTIVQSWLICLVQMLVMLGLIFSLLIVGHLMIQALSAIAR